MKLTSIDFSRRVAEGSISSWLQALGNKLINRSPYIRYANRKCYLLYKGTSCYDTGCATDQHVEVAKC